jgi:hypothetical protein
MTDVLDRGARIDRCDATRLTPAPAPILQRACSERERVSYR